MENPASSTTGDFGLREGVAIVTMSRIVPLLRIMTGSPLGQTLRRPRAPGTQGIRLRHRHLGRMIPKHMRQNRLPAGSRSVPAVAELTVSQKIILAAYHLEEEGNTPFSAEALI